MHKQSFMCTLLLGGLFFSPSSAMLRLYKNQTPLKRPQFSRLATNNAHNKKFLEELKKKPRLPQISLDINHPGAFHFKAPYPYPYGYLRHLPNSELSNACVQERKDKPLSVLLLSLAKTLEWIHQDGKHARDTTHGRRITSIVEQLLSNKPDEIQKKETNKVFDICESLHNDYDLKGTKINLIPREIRLPEFNIILYLNRDGMLKLNSAHDEFHSFCPYSYLELLEHPQLKDACYKERKEILFNTKLFILNNQLECAHHDGASIRFGNGSVIEHIIHNLLHNESASTKKEAFEEFITIAGKLYEQCGIDPNEL